MLLNDFLKKLKKVEFHTKSRSNEALSGTYHSAFKGRGMLFSECRAYADGDDVRYIDWNASARQNGIFVKQFEEERELSVYVILDLSSPMSFGSVGMTKAEKAIEALSIVAFSALQNNDKVGLFIFNEAGMQYVPQVKGKSSIVYLILKALRFSPENGPHQLRSVLSQAMALLRRRSLIFIISDFMGVDYEEELKHLSHHHEVIPIVVADPLEKRMPDMGYCILEDCVTKDYIVADTGRREFQEYYAEQYRLREQNQKQAFTRAGLKYVRISTIEDIVKPISGAFVRRAMHV